MNKIVTNFLANAYDKLKASNPKLAAFIHFILIMIIIGMEKIVELLPFIQIPAGITEWLEYILMFFLASIGSRTTRYLKPIKDDQLIDKPA